MPEKFKEKQETFLEKLNARAKKIYLALGLMAGLAGGMESRAYAEETPEKPVAAIDVKSIRKSERLDGKGEVFFARTVPREAEIGGEKGKETASIIKIADRDDKKNEIKIKGQLYKFQGKKISSWDISIETEGRIDASKLGKFEPTRQKGGNVNMAREIFNSKLLSLGQIQKLIEGLNEVGENKSEEAEQLKIKLEKEYSELAKKFPSQRLNEAELTKLLGRKPQILKESSKDTRMAGEKELDIPAPVTAKDMPKANPFK